VASIICQALGRGVPRGGAGPLRGAHRGLLERERVRGPHQGRSLQLDGIKPRVESAYGVCNQRLKLKSHKLLSTFAFNFNLRRHTKAGSLKSSREVKKAGPTPTPLVVYWSTRTLSPHPPPAAWPLVPFAGQPNCLLIVYRCTRTDSPHPPPWPGRSLPFQLSHGNHWQGPALRTAWCTTSTS